MKLGEISTSRMSLGVQTWDPATKRPDYRDLSCGGGCLAHNGKANRATRNINIDGIWAYLCEECCVELASFKLHEEPEEKRAVYCGNYMEHFPHTWTGVAEWFHCGGVS